jgi:hypothetical protein
MIDALIACCRQAHSRFVWSVGLQNKLDPSEWGLKNGRRFTAFSIFGHSIFEECSFLRGSSETYYA